MNERNDAGLRRAFTGMSDIAGSGQACPPADRLWRSARGDLRGARQEQIVLHLGECGACASAWRVARELRVAETPRRTHWFGLPAMTAAAAVIVLSIGLAALFALRQPAPLVFRDQRQDVLVATEASAVLPRERFELVWSGETEGTAYNVIVTRENLDPVYRADQLSEPNVVVPVVALEEIPAGTRLLWQVTAFRPDGRTLVSDTHRSTLE